MFKEFYNDNCFSYKILDENIIASVTDLNGIIKYVSTAFSDITGYSKEELVGKKHNIIRHPDMPEKLYKDLWNTIKSGKRWKGIIKNKKKNGGYYWVKAYIEPYYSEENEHIGYISVRTDITDIIDGESKLDDYRKGLDESSYFFITDKNYKIKSINKKLLNVLGMYSKDLIGKKIFNNSLNGQYFLHGFISDKDFRESVHSNKIWKGVINFVSKTGETLSSDTTFIPVLFGDGKVNEHLFIGHDVTNIEKAKKELKKSNNKLKELDIRKSEFLNIASHDLRTPMTSIKGYLSMFLEGDFGTISPEQTQYIQEMYNDSNRMIELINDMLDISKLENGKMEFSYEKFNVIELAKDLINEIMPLIKEKNQSLELKSNLERIIVRLDKKRIWQSIMNLLSNANKYTDNGGKIELILKVEKRIFTIEVKDNGFGIAKENQKKVFDKFGKIVNDRTRDLTGTGLGLPIVKSIINGMGGEVFLKSELNEGSSFKIKFKI